jgi:hypothetical protein
MKVKSVSYGRTIELGKFGRGHTQKVWFGWEVEREEGESEEACMTQLRAMADAQETQERKAWKDAGGREP